MKLLLALAVVALALAGCTSESAAPPAGGDVKAAASATPAAPTVEVGCAMCTYKKEGVQGCEAAVKLGDRVLLLSVPGFDAHKEGLCKGARQAVITGGKEEGGKYVASKIELAK